MSTDSAAALPGQARTIPERAGPLHPDLAAIARIGAVPTILKVVSEITGLRLALIARVTPDRWTACAVLDRMNFGLDVGDHLDVATTLCSEVRDSHAPIVIENASVDPAFCSHPTPKMYGFESYIAVPIFRPDGRYFGNVCALDSRPAVLRDERTLEMMRLFAELVSLQLVADEESVRDREALSDERETAELREQFIAVLGHDLRNPLTSVLAGSSFLLRTTEDVAQRRIVERIHGSGHRMSRLIDDIMDFARGRLGGGMPLEPERVDVAGLVREVAAEIASAHEDRTIRVTAPETAGTAWLDRSRVSQLLSNLVANAATHGAPDLPIDVGVARTGSAPGDATGDAVRFTVTSRGAPIPAALMPRLFEPYVRAACSREGLGLGLYIVSEIVRAHRGVIDVDSTPAGVTTFVVTLPVGTDPRAARRR